jgi:hypothetical protein
MNLPQEGDQGRISRYPLQRTWKTPSAAFSRGMHGVPQISTHLLSLLRQLGIQLLQSMKLGNQSVMAEFIQYPAMAFLGILSTRLPQLQPLD